MSSERDDLDGHMLRKEGEDSTKKMLNMQLVGKRRRVRPKK